MKKYLLLTTALALVGSATTAQAGCSDNNLQVTRLNPTELSGYQKCWLQEHRPDEPSGVVGNLFYFETVKGEYFSTTVESLVKMKSDAAAEYVTAQVVSATMDRVEEIMNEDGTVAKAGELQDAALDLEKKIESEIVKADKLVKQQQNLEETIDLLESAALEDIEAIQVIKEQVKANEETIASLEKYSSKLEVARVRKAEDLISEAEKKALEESLATLEADNAELTADLKEARQALLTLIDANIADRNDLKDKHRAKIIKIETQRDDANKVKDALEAEKKVRETEILKLTESLKDVNAELVKLQQKHERTVARLEKTIETLRNDVKGLDMDVKDAGLLQRELERKLAHTRDARNENAKALKAKNEKIEQFLTDKGFVFNLNYELIEDKADAENQSLGYEHWRDKRNKELAERKKVFEDVDAFGDFGNTEGKYVQLYAVMDDEPHGGKRYVSTSDFGDIVNGFADREVDFVIKAGASAILDNDRDVGITLKPDSNAEHRVTMALIEVSVKEAVEKVAKKAVDQVAEAYLQGYTDGRAAGYEEGFRDGYVAASIDYRNAAKDHFGEQ